MKNKSYGIYCISVLLLVIAASVYPIIMGARILADWLASLRLPTIRNTLFHTHR